MGGCLVGGREGGREIEIERGSERGSSPYIKFCNISQMSNKLNVNFWISNE